MNRLRSVTHCPHRQASSETAASASEQSAARCNLVSQLHSNVTVPPAICHACCNFPVPTLPELNPVVASHIYATVAAAAQQFDQTDQQRLSQLQLMQFCQLRLARAGAATLDDSHERLTASALDDRISPADRRPPGRSVPEHRRPRGHRRPPGPRIGLMGWNSRFGLGHVNRDLAKHLNVIRWLAPSGTAMGPGRLRSWDAPTHSAHQLERWLKNIELVLFMEQPPFPALLQRARQQHKPVVCIPNWEWLTPGLPWLMDVDLMLCPTRFTANLLQEWKTRYGFEWQIEYLPWPIEISRFAFRQRQVCQRFLYVGGRGGALAHDIQRPQRSVRRKGLELVLRAAEKLPRSQFVVFTTEPIRHTPTNVTVHGYVPTNAELYTQGDVCLQPSYWEGIGLPLLECQAAGLPLITTDIPPLNEYDPWAVIPSREQFLGQIENGYTIPIPIIDVGDLTEVLKSLQGRSVAAASFRARHFVETQHAWSLARPRLLDLFAKLVDCRAR